MFLFWLSLFFTSLLYLFLLWHELGIWLWQSGFGILFLLLLGLAAFQLQKTFGLFIHVRQLGWGISLPVYLFHLDELGLKEARLIPRREEFELTPSFNPDATELDNLREALLLARGWDEETRLWREMVLLYTPLIPQTIDMVLELLRAEGFLAIIDSPTTESTYGGAILSGNILIPKAQKEEAVEFLSHYFENNPKELERIHR
ncbi:MAG: hypothetical protein SFY68_02705 [Candidatus Sumerlaeia bacterium]|nr:hypothetical protein [Candidatus Sumerlaeia bacterium]